MATPVEILRLLADREKHDHGLFTRGHDGPRSPLPDLGRFLALRLRSRSGLAVENLFRHRQFALLEERSANPQRVTAEVRFAMSALGRLVDWRHVLRVAGSSWEFASRLVRQASICSGAARDARRPRSSSSAVCAAALS